MPITTSLKTTRAEEHQKRWNHLCRDPSLNDLPYKTEPNHRGQLILTPLSVSRSMRMGEVMEGPDNCTSKGESYPSFAIATPRGTKVPEVVWASEDRFEEMQETGDPTTLAPEICIDVMSEYNDWEEMHAKRELYLEAGAEEVWVVTGDGHVRFFAEEELEESRVAEGFPGDL